MPVDPPERTTGQTHQTTPRTAHGHIQYLTVRPLLLALSELSLLLSLFLLLMRLLSLLLLLLPFLMTATLLVWLCLTMLLWLL